MKPRSWPIGRRYEVGDRVQFLRAPDRWEDVTIARRIPIMSCADTLMGYKYLVMHSSGYKSNVSYEWEIRPCPPASEAPER